ncbi:hypothetical protein PIB30_078796 [Stylosanthes scabra]|uniref:Uncharacterized protein n=1 Tax=Stylosanthes scabra TaxID=79078 RepID=A0ABU6RRN1_9FABA|nr:hypothetical protein [Stylosanthes scabra]
MACNGPFTSAKGKAKAYGPPTRASPRLATLWSQPAANRHPETPVTLTLGAPTSTLPPKKRPIPKKAGEGTSKAASRSFRRRSDGWPEAGLENRRPKSQQNSSKSRVTRKNSPVVHFAPN